MSPPPPSPAPRRDLRGLGLRLHLSLWLIATALMLLLSKGAFLPWNPLARGALLMAVLGTLGLLWWSRRSERLALVGMNALSLTLLSALGIEVVMSRIRQPAVEVTRFPYPFRVHGFAPNRRPEDNAHGASSNEVGLRSRERIPRHSPGELRILVLGGSTVFGLGSDDDHTPPALMEARLKEVLLHRQPRAGIDRVRVINAGQGWYTSTQELIYFISELVLYEPDLVMVVDGYNDAHSGLVWGYPPPLNAVIGGTLWTSYRSPGLLTEWPNWGQGLQLAASSSRLLRRLGLSSAVLFYGDTGIEPQLPGAAPADPVARHSATVHHRLLMNWTLLQRLCGAIGLPVRFALQPTIYPKRKAPEEARWLATQSYAASMSQAWSALEELVASEAPRLGLRTFSADLHLREDPRPLFTDYCHLTSEGNALLARSMAEATLEALDEGWPWQVRWEGIRYTSPSGDPFWRAGDALEPGDWR